MWRLRMWKNDGVLFEEKDGLSLSQNPVPADEGIGKNLDASNSRIWTGWFMGSECLKQIGMRLQHLCFDWPAPTPDGQTADLWYSDN